MGVLWMFVMLASCIMDRITIKNFKTGALRADLRMTWKPPVAAKSLGRRRGSGLGEHTAEANQNNAHPLDNAAVLEEPGHRKSERQHELELAIDAVAQRAQEVQHAAHEDVHPRRQGPAHEDDDLGAGGEAAEGHERLDALSDLCHGDHDGEAPDGGPRRQAERTLALLLGNRGSTPSSGSGTGTPRGRAGGRRACTTARPARTASPPRSWPGRRAPAGAVASPRRLTQLDAVRGRREKIAPTSDTTAGVLAERAMLLSAREALFSMAMFRELLAPLTVGCSMHEATRPVTAIWKAVVAYGYGYPESKTSLTHSFTTIMPARYTSRATKDTTPCARRSGTVATMMQVARNPSAIRCAA
ncbi:unnamed protein product, partial [Prorocentrum cordatum]